MNEANLSAFVVKGDPETVALILQQAGIEIVEKRNGGFGCYISALKAEISWFCEQRNMTLTQEESEVIAQRLANNDELNNTQRDQIDRTIDEYLLEQPIVVQALILPGKVEQGAIDEYSEKGFDRSYPTPDGLLLTKEMEELSEEEVRELSEMCNTRFVTGFRGHRVVLGQS
ncbi:hypothetical protein [Paenibacillus abyssi]|uniref:Uncharacterized protein n=1 Tax=Paenibacillus abyssi TaxID=1340531 RepID=A0A917G1K2_9BACL|nr:hypothetical protein [Paenibacillus abyssi]GGG18376.1 hypothetical protein GCM10010916_39010 [Paenibacillus abyssi]